MIRIKRRVLGSTRAGLQWPHYIVTIAGVFHLDTAISKFQLFVRGWLCIGEYKSIYGSSGRKEKGEEVITRRHEVCIFYKSDCGRVGKVTAQWK